MSWKQPAGWTLAGLLTTGTAAVLCATLVSLPGSVSAAPISRGTSPVTSATRTPSTPITSHDRVYTTDQSSNTVSVIDPSNARHDHAGRAAAQQRAQSAVHRRCRRPRTDRVEGRQADRR